VEYKQWNNYTEMGLLTVTDYSMVTRCRLPGIMLTTAMQLSLYASVHCSLLTGCAGMLTPFLICCSSHSSSWSLASLWLSNTSIKPHSQHYKPAVISTVTGYMIQDGHWWCYKTVVADKICSGWGWKWQIMIWSAILQSYFTLLRWLQIKCKEG